MKKKRKKVGFIGLGLMGLALAGSVSAPIVQAQEVSLTQQSRSIQDHNRQAQVLPQGVKIYRKRKGLLSDGSESGNNPLRDRLQYWRPTKRMSYRTIQRNAFKRRKQRAKASK
jgi:hypothetical protein